jgi:hypothetical protein
MNQVQSATNPGTTAAVTSQQVILNGQSVEGDLLIVSGTFADSTTGPISVTPTVTDNAGNVYSIASVPFHSGVNQDFWLQYCVVGFTTSVTVTVTYNQSVTNASVGVEEFASANGWNVPVPLLDGQSAGTSGPSTGSTPINSGSITTTNGDDLIFAMVGYTLTTLVPATGWAPSAQIRLNVATFWIEQSSVGSIGFTATQGGGASAIWAAAIWAFQANVAPGPPITFNLITATVNPTQFQEAYQNRIPEDIYDSLTNNPNFVFVPYGPSPLNV